MLGALKNKFQKNNKNVFMFDDKGARKAYRVHIFYYDCIFLYIRYKNSWQCYTDPLLHRKYRTRQFLVISLFFFFLVSLEFRLFGQRQPFENLLYKGHLTQFESVLFDLSNDQ